MTSCFKEDRNPDLRGVEEMYLPLDDPEVDALYSAEEMRVQKIKYVLWHFANQVRMADNVLIGNSSTHVPKFTLD